MHEVFMRYLLYILFLPILFISCTEDSNDDILTPKPKLTIIMSINGLGDMGYNDKIMSGIMKFYDNYEIEMNLIHPESETEVETHIYDWLQNSRDNKKSLLLLADSEYEKYVLDKDITLTENQKILLFESKKTNLACGISSFYINRYGVSYLAGCMAGEHNSATIIAAMPNNSLLEESINGFTEGYNSITKKDVDVIYLSKDESGFSKPDLAFQTTGNIENSFIFPLAGGSNSGIYKYSRETPFYLSLIAGMDTDCSLFSPRIPFSVVINIDKLVFQYLSEWYNGNEWEKNKVYGLKDGFTDIAISPVFYNRLSVWEDYYDNPDYWSNVYSLYKEEAKEKEEKYELGEI